MTNVLVPLHHMVTFQFSPPSFLWAKVHGSEFVSKVNNMYEEVIHWRHNLFSVQVGKAAKQFVQELAQLFQSFANGSALEGTALKAALLMPILLMQKQILSCILERMQGCWEGNY